TAVPSISLIDIYSVHSPQRIVLGRRAGAATEGRPYRGFHCFGAATVAAKIDSHGNNNRRRKIGRPGGTTAPCTAAPTSQPGNSWGKRFRAHGRRWAA